MTKRLFYYFQQWIIFIFLELLAIFLYYRKIDLFLKSIERREYNIILIGFSILVFAYIFDLISSKSNGNRNVSMTNKEVLQILGKTLVVIILTSFIEQFVFYSTKIGRIVYIELWLMLSILFILKRQLETKKRKNSNNYKILWLSSVPPSEVALNYDISNILKNIVKPDRNTDNPAYLIYDYPPKNKSLTQTIVKKVIGGTKAKDLITFIEENTERIPLDYVDELWLLYNIKSPNSFYNKAEKVLDFFLSFILLIILFPIGFMFALAHCIESKGPIFYKQERLGFKGKKFKLIKFRTMIPDAEKEGPKFASENDPRITKIGKIMRKFRIDEIPQFINVLKGDLSLIGPRPEREVFVKELEKKIPFYRLRLEVKPGITGWAQVNYRYAGNNLDDHKKKLEYDLYYIKNKNLILDIIIIIKTIKTVVMSI